MTLPKGSHYCPLCCKIFLAMSNHLRRSHSISNVEERRILLNLATNRVNIRHHACPVLGCTYKSTRLDRHLIDSHPELTPAEASNYLDAVRRTKTIALLAGLRASNPVPPMVSALDLEAEEEGDDVHMGGEPQEEESTCADPECIRRLQSWYDANRCLKEKNKNLEKELTILRRRYKRLTTKHRCLSKAAGLQGPGEQAEEEEESGSGEAEEEVASQQQAPGPEAAARSAEEEEEEEKEDDDEEEEGEEEEENKAAGTKQEQAGPSRPSLTKKEQQAVSRRLFNKSGRLVGTKNLIFPGSIETYLKEYQRFQEGSCSSQKQLENAFSNVSRVKSFFFFMAFGSKDLHTWRFLDNPDKVRKWASHLQSTGKTITTANFYLRNVYQFVKYLKETPPSLCRLTKAQMTGVVRAVRGSLANITKKVVLHQIKVKADKLAKVISRETLKKCREMAKIKIRELLHEMKHDDTQQLRYRFYGYFSAFVACIYGHRTGVLTNMTVDEVNAAKNARQSSTSGFVLSVSEHKTNRDFGAAQIYFEPEEFNWLETWLEIREKCDPPNNLVFFTAGKGPAKNMVRYMQGAWAEMGLPGRPSFIDIRTAVSAHAKNVHAAKVRSRMATFMCHNTSTADKFYALNLDTQQSYEMRRLFEGVTSSSTTTASPSAAATTSAAASTSAASSSSTPRSRKRKRTPPSDNKQEHEEEEEEEEGAHSQATESTPEKHCSAYKQYAKVMVKLSPLGEKLKAAQKATTRAKREALRELKRSSTPEKEPKSPTEEE